jgi:cytochrome c biogenesis protein
MAATEIEVRELPDIEPATPKPGGSNALDRALRLLSSVRFGIVMLVLLLICCMIGMLIVQQDMDGFRDYYQRLTPAQRYIYAKLGFFHIYHSWYFSLLLAITGLNIILASIDRFPAAWHYVTKPKLIASPKFILSQMFKAEARFPEPPSALAEQISEAWQKVGWRARLTEADGRWTIFAQRNAWNRLGAYVVHLALLIIFSGGFLTNRFGLGGMMEIVPGRTSDSLTTVKVEVEGTRVGTVKLPFAVECLDIQQKLVRPDGGLEASNTIDWLSYIKIKDNGHEREALVHLNEPFDYKGDEPPANVPWLIHKLLGGFRFFQSQFQPIGNAREIKLSFEPVSGNGAQLVSIKRNGSAKVEGIGEVYYKNFYPDFRFEGRPTTASGEYNNPVAELEIKLPDGKVRRAFAVRPEVADDFYKMTDELLVAGRRVILKDFEKVGTSHTLAVQYDPGRTPVYVGFLLLAISLFGVFFFAHQRVWAVLEPEGNGSRVYFGGNTNRNKPAFEARFNLLVEAARKWRDL